jgi:hypothetical protein
MRKGKHGVLSSIVQGRIYLVETGIGWRVMTNELMTSSSGHFGQVFRVR